MKLEFDNAKFCPECGFSLTKGEVPTKQEVPTKVAVREGQEGEAKPSASVFDLGNKLEQVVEKILQARGYETERRRRLQGRSGTSSEIDIIGRKTVVQLESVNDAIVAAVKKLGLRNIEVLENKLVINVSNPEKENPDIVDAVYGAGGRVQFVTEVSPTLEDVYLKLVRS